MLQTTLKHLMNAVDEQSKLQSLLEHISDPLTTEQLSAKFNEIDDVFISHGVPAYMSTNDTDHFNSNSTRKCIVDLNSLDLEALWIRIRSQTIQRESLIKQVRLSLLSCILS